MTVTIIPLTYTFTVRHAKELIGLVHEIPQMSYTEQDLLAKKELPNGKLLTTKWHYSLVAVDQGRPIGVAIGYERKPDGTKNYPKASIHLEVLALAPNYRGKGLGGRLLGTFLRHAYELNRGRYIQMGGPFQFSLTTSATPANETVRQLYESFGFHPGIYRRIDSLPFVTMRGSGNQVLKAMNATVSQDSETD